MREVPGTQQTRPGGATTGGATTVVPQQNADAAQQAQTRAVIRPGYYPTVGDRNTVAYMQSIRRINEINRIMGLPIIDEEAVTGLVLESQRQHAISTPGTRDDQFFRNEEEKWNRRGIEISSEYHRGTLLSGVPAPANPFENWGDVSLAFEKGGYGKDFGKNYAFNPNVGRLIAALPGGRGLQEVGWQTARTGITSPGDFFSAIGFVNSQRNRQGVYGRLAGGIPDTQGTVSPTPFKSTPQLPQPFISGTTTTVPATGKLSLLPRIVQGTGGSPGIEFTGVRIPFISDIAAYFEGPTVQTSFRGSPVVVDITRMGGADFTRAFITPEGKKVSEMAFPVGEPVYGERVAIGTPVITTEFNPATRVTETTTTQEYQQNIMQKFDTVKLSNTGLVRPITTFSTKGQSDFNKYVKAQMPELKQDTRNLSPLFASYKTNEGKEMYLFGSDLGPKLDTMTKGPVKFIQSVIPTTPQWSRETYTNIRENPGFGVPMAAFSVALVSIGTISRAAGVGTRLLAPTTRAGAAYMFGSQVATAGLGAMFADYGLKETTGTGIFDIARNEYTRAITGGKSQTTLVMMQKNFPGWDVASQKANRVELEAGIAIAAYLGSNKVGDKVTDYLSTRNRIETTNPHELIVPSVEGFPTNPALNTRDLVASFEQGKMTTVPIEKLGQTRMSITGRPMIPEDFPANPQRLATAGRTDVFSGADYPHLNTGFIGAGHSEIPGMSVSPSGLSYFTKPGTGIGGFGISNDILGIYRRPTMYITGTKAGEYTSIPESILRTPTRGMSMNDPMNPRNIAIGDWIEASNAEYGRPIIGQHGKSEFEFHLRAGGEVVVEPAGFYRDAGRRIPVDRFTSTGKVSAKFELPGPKVRTTNVFRGVPVTSSIGSSNKIPAPLVLSSMSRGPDTSISRQLKSYGATSRISDAIETSRISSLKSSLSSRLFPEKTGSGKSHPSSIIDTTKLSYSDITRSMTRTPTISKTLSDITHLTAIESKPSSFTEPFISTMPSITRTPTRTEVPLSLPGILPAGDDTGIFALRRSRGWNYTNPVGADLLKSGSRIIGSPDIFRGKLGKMPTFKVKIPKMKNMKF
jgi:hypothetical protein